MKKVKCTICGFESVYLRDHILEIHGVSLDEYQGDVAHPDFLDAFYKRKGRKRVAHPGVDQVNLQFGLYDMRVHPYVSRMDCLPIPAHYRVPAHGLLGQDVRAAIIALKKNRNIYIHGAPGCGKDALIHAYSGLVRRPCLFRQVIPETDVEAWFFHQGFKNGQDHWHEGELLKALRDGYTDRKGNKIPYLILITDFDRATPSQAEILRTILDTTEPRVSGPEGVTYPVFPGTQIICTGNSCGAGDESGMCVSTQSMDASMLDRFQGIYKFHPMDWADEGPICQAKYPLLLEKAPKAFDQVGKAVTTVRNEIARGEAIYFEMSHRAVMRWLTAAQDIVDVENEVPRDLLKRSLRAMLDGTQDRDTRDQLQKLIDPAIPEGSLDLGNRTKKGSLTI